jgi:hypothetical protein
MTNRIDLFILHNFPYERGKLGEKVPKHVRGLNQQVKKCKKLDVDGHVNSRLPSLSKR